MARWVWLSVVLGAVVVVGALFVWKPAERTTPALLLQQTGVVALAPPPPGVDWPLAEDHPAVREAANGTDPDRLRSALLDAGLSGLWVEVTPYAAWDPELPPLEMIRGTNRARTTALAISTSK